MWGTLKIIYIFSSRSTRCKVSCKAKFKIGKFRLTYFFCLKYIKLKLFFKKTVSLKGFFET